MNLGQARRLKVGDEVTIKATNEIVKIISLTPKRNIIMVGAMTRDGLKSLYNDEVIL
jgi:hypothetical protein